MKKGIVNGVFVILAIVAANIVYYVATSSIMDGGVSALLFLLAIMLSGYWCKRKYSMSFSIFNNSNNKKLFKHAAGIASVIVLVLLLSGGFKDIFNLNEYGALVGIILIPIIIGAQSLSIMGLMIVGGFFYKIKDEPNPLSTKLVAVASFDDSVLAQMAQDVLVDNEIPAYLQNEFTSSIWANSLERIRIQVPPEFREKAECILKEAIPSTES